jgi:hypothetical protein
LFPGGVGKDCELLMKNSSVRAIDFGETTEVGNGLRHYFQMISATGVALYGYA